MKNIQLYTVAPHIPEQLSFLEVLSRNLWWAWNHDAIELFRRIDQQLWKSSSNNAVVFLSRVRQAQLEKLAKDDSFLSHLERVRERFEAQVASADTTDVHRSCIAYFSLEYGIHESIRLYSGGLGCLAGDHLKTASDMNLPLIAVGLFYRQGFFQQYLNDEGWQQESYSENEIDCLPVRRACAPDGSPVLLSIPLPEGPLHAVIWRMNVGRIPLFLLDTNIPENPPELRKITLRLYDGDRTMRLRQELLLGLGGFRAITTLGYDPPTCHMNEGHAGLLAIGRLEHMIKHKGLSLDAALEILPRTNVFTTHTPVPAGNEKFALDLVKPYLTALEPEVGIPASLMASWGQPSHPTGQEAHEFCLTILGLRMAHYSNGVSELHGHVTRQMWRHLWPGRPDDEIPIHHVTNGVHSTSWIGTDLIQLFDKYLGPEWRDNPSDTEVLARIDQIPDDELWKTHELGRSRLVRMAREAGTAQYAVRSAKQAEITQMKSILNFDALTIGFARRFAVYKRANLILSDPDRLRSILLDEERPVQLVFAGKAHPADHEGKDLIRQIIHFAHEAGIRQRIIFLENYDIRIARYLVQGVDVWLNTPRRPLEASGTSGMKAALNGALNVSVLDGWWDEGYTAENGWAIGNGEEYENLEYQDKVESQALYNRLENEVIPLFYDRPDSDIPTQWIQMMKQAIRTSLASFTSYRMVGDYNQRFYVPVMTEYAHLVAENGAKAARLAAQRKHLQEQWHQVQIDAPQAQQDTSALHVGDHYDVTTVVSLGSIKPEDVDVEVYYGPVNAENVIIETHTVKMDVVEDKGHGHYLYRQQVPCKKTGRYGFTARVTPLGADWKQTIPGFITWANIA